MTVQDDDPDDDIWRPGREALAYELYDLRCKLGEAEVGERSYTPERLEEMRRRVAVLEPLVGDYLKQLRADED